MTPPVDEEEGTGLDPRYAITPSDLIDTLLERFEVTNVEELSAKIGHSARQIYRWKAGQEPRFATTIDLLERGRLLEWPEQQLGREPDEMLDYLRHLTHEYAEGSWDIWKRHTLLENAVLSWIAERDGPYAAEVAKRLKAVFGPAGPPSEEEEEVAVMTDVRSIGPRLRELEAKVAELPTAADIQSAVATLQAAIESVAIRDSPAAPKETRKSRAS